MKNYGPEDLQSPINNDFVSLSELQKGIENLINTCKLNKVNPDNVPVVISNQTSFDKYPLLKINFSYKIRKSIYLDFGFYENDAIDFNPKDERPEEGEYWQSRGATDFDCSGFVKSKQAGERIMRYVHAILEKDETKTFLDWRKMEPTWIQLKFDASEFDVYMLDKLTRENNGIITYEILKTCKL